MTENHKYLLLLFPIVGMGIFIGGLIYRRHLKAKVANCVRTTGTVIDNVTGAGDRPDYDTTPLFRPVVEYFVGSNRFTIAGDTGRQQRKDKGTKLTVVYNPANPLIAFIVEDYYFAANVLLAIGGAFVLFGSLIAYELIT